MMYLSNRVQFLQQGDEYILSLSEGQPLSALPLQSGTVRRIHGRSVVQRLFRFRLFIAAIEHVVLIGVLLYMALQYAESGVLGVILVLCCAFMVARLEWCFVDRCLMDDDDNQFNLSQDIVVVGSVPVKLVE